jgi:hypothetical protein
MTVVETSVAPGSFARRLREIDMFFAGNDPIHKTMRRVAELLEKEGIANGLLGGMAVNAHGYRRTTDDVDFLLTTDGLAAFLVLAGSNHFERVTGRSRRFTDGLTGVRFDVVLTGKFPGSGAPGPIAFPDPAEVTEVIDHCRVVTLAKLIELKLAAHRHKDFGDVVELIGVHHLDESFLIKLHPIVHGDFIECLEEKRREEQYELRQDQEADRSQGERSS